jgi:hypothetical protein
MDGLEHRDRPEIHRLCEDRSGLGSRRAAVERLLEDTTQLEQTGPAVGPGLQAGADGLGGPQAFAADRLLDARAADVEAGADGLPGTDLTGAVPQDAARRRRGSTPTRCNAVGGRAERARGS